MPDTETLCLLGITLLSGVITAAVFWALGEWGAAREEARKEARVAAWNARVAQKTPYDPNSFVVDVDYETFRRAVIRDLQLDPKAENAHQLGDAIRRKEIPAKAGCASHYDVARCRWIRHDLRGAA